ncbi:MAG: pimeloyl-ACP methyl ester carboxylesterase [Verrucomicrobiales bacterium]
MTITINLSVSHDGIVTRSFAEFDGFEHSTRQVQSGGIALHAEALLAVGGVAEPCVLLSEAEAPSSRWPSELLLGVADLTGGAIWFDTRDTGRSAWIDSPYAMQDLADDVVAVIDSFGAERVHVIGRSMGGQVAQHFALSWRERVRSLTLLSTTPGRREEFGMPQQWLIDKMTDRLFDPAPPDAEGRALWIVEQLEWFSGPVFEFDREAALALAVAEVAEGWRGPNGHGHAVVDAPDVVDQVGEICAKALVIHGTADPVYPIEHGQALAELLGNARLTLIEGLGHELPAAFVPSLLELMAEGPLAS